MPVSVSGQRRSPSRFRIYAWAAAVFLVIAFAATVVASVVVNRKKDELISGAKALVFESAKNLGAEVAHLLETAQVSGVMDLSPQEQLLVREQLHTEVQTQIALTAYTLIEDGQVAYMVEKDGTERGALVDGNGSVPLPEALSEETVTIPIEKAGGGEMQIVYFLSPQRVESSLKPMAQQISAITWTLVVVMLVLMLAVVLILSRLFGHTMALHEEADRLDRLAYVGTLSAGLAHEIRNPLNAMSINVDLIASDLGTDSRADPATREMIGGVKTEIMHLNKIVENFLAYARPTRKTGETVDLVRAVHEAVASVGPEMESRGVTCQVEPVDQEVLVNADPTGLHQSLGNILLNAAQAMDKPEKRITVTTQVDGQRVDLTIGDTGRGIPPDELQRIFEVFYSSRSGGSGLGLPTARRVIEDVGGSMTVDSLAGHGTQVTITLPLAKKRRLFG